MSFENNTLEGAHKHSIFNKAEILQSNLCGCFYCFKSFFPTDIVEWVDKDNPKGMTPLCPHCGIDSVIGDKSGFPITDQNFLAAMNSYYF
jgi:hypothetical protein